MSDLRELYQQLIIDHGRNPRNFCEYHDANHIKEGYNPLCGDEITVYIFEENNKIQKAYFYGKGCAISIASASLMCEIICGKTIEDVKKIFDDFHCLVSKNEVSFKSENDKKLQNLGKLQVLTGVKAFPMRVKCATLAWHTMMAALKNDKDPV